MPAPTPSSSGNAPPPPPSRAGGFLRAATEAVVLLLACWAPWPFGSSHPAFEFVLLAGVAVVVVLWGLTVLVEWRFAWKRCPAALCLAGLVLLGVAQLAPLPDGLLPRLSPEAARLLAQLKP